jgi:hypothetical protein
MTNYQKGIVVIAVCCGLLVSMLTYFFVLSTRKKDKEVNWIEHCDPAVEARQAFQKNEIYFLEIWQPYSSKKEIIGEWILPGENLISPEILEQYDMRIQLRSTYNYDVTLQHEQYRKDTRQFARIYNLTLTNLISQSSASPVK